MSQTQHSGCTSLDHIYPKRKFGTTCYCGERTWGKRTPNVPVEKSTADDEKVLASVSTPDVGLSHTSETASEAVSTHNGHGEKNTMTATLNYKGLSKSGKYAMYSGLRTVIRIATTNFPDAKPVPSFTAEGEFAGPREKLTPEERKARLKAKPKLTLAEQIAKDEARLAKRKAKLEAEQAKEGQPVGA